MIQDSLRARHHSPTPVSLSLSLSLSLTHTHTYTHFDAAIERQRILSTNIVQVFMSL
jgi:hypothetical protein